MEISNSSHPNFQRWQRGEELASERAVIVNKIISSDKICKGLNILDIGSGEGGTSSYFSECNLVFSYDLNLVRLKRQQKKFHNQLLINGMAEHLPFPDSSFDLVILQDVIEHIAGRDLLVIELKRILKSNGLIYLSTPNKLSLLNIISDPHWGIPLLSLFKRDRIKKYFLRYYRQEDLIRDDIAQLLSLKEIFQLFQDYKITLYTKEVVNFLSDDYKGIIWSNFHVKFYNLLKKFHLILLLTFFANNKPGLINKYFTPTYFLIIKNNSIIQSVNLQIR